MHAELDEARASIARGEGVSGEGPENIAAPNCGTARHGRRSRMKVRITFSPHAERDLAEIDAWLTLEASLLTAASALERILNRPELLADMPLSGVARQEFDSTNRFVIASSYVIYYDAHGDRVEVLRLLHKARDRDRIMRGGDQPDQASE